MNTKVKKPDTCTKRSKPWSFSSGYRTRSQGLLPILAACLIIALPVPALAQAGDAVTRADPVSYWDFSANPASQAFAGDAFSMALRANFDLTKLDEFPDSGPGKLDLGLGAGGLRYESLWESDRRLNRLTSAIGLRSFGAGLGISWEAGEKLTGPESRYDFGILYRPFNLLSLGLTLEDAFADTPSWGAGLALRPLAFWPRLESTLTLSTDARWENGSPRMQNIAARLRLGSWYGLKLWFEPETRTAGLQTHFRLGSGEAELLLPKAASPENTVLASALRVDLPSRRTPLPFGKMLLVLDDPGLIPSTPSLHAMPGSQERLWLGSLTSAIERAAKDPQIAGLVMYHPPTVNSLADGQALLRSLAIFKDAGKPVFVHARYLERANYLHSAAMADYLAIDPNGQLSLVELGSFNLYFRGFFEKLGIRMYNLQSHDTKTAYNSFTEYTMTEAERAMKERYITGLASQTHSNLSQARGDRLSRDAATLIGSGPYLIPTQALEAGLVDAIAYRDDFDKTVMVRLGKMTRLDMQEYLAATGDSWGSPAGSKTVVVLHLQGGIIDDEGVAGKSIGEATVKTLAALREDRQVSGIVLRVDSGGGSALMSNLIAREVALTVEAGKPVYVSMGSYAASGGYYISAPASRIYSEEGTITGSIGVTGLWPDAAGMLEKLGIGTASVDAGDSAAFGNTLLPRREEDIAVLNSAIHHIYDRFLEVVAKGRSMDRDKVDALGRGQIWLGSEAVANGLVDEAGGLEAAKAGIKEALGGSVRFVDHLPGQNPVSVMNSLMGLAPVQATLKMAGIPQAGLASSPSAVPVTIRQALELAAELEAFGNGPLTLLPDYLFRNRASW